MKFYIVEDTENLNIILSSGMISPEKFIKKRSFSGTRYKLNKYNLFSDVLTLYKNPPKIKEGILLEVNIKKEMALKKIDNTLYIYNGSLILNKNKIKILIFKEMFEKVVRRANLSSEIKVSNMLNFFKENNKKCSELNLEKYKNLNIKNELIEKYVYVDELLNKIRGAISLEYYLNEKFLFANESSIELLNLTDEYVKKVGKLKKYNKNTINSLINFLDENIHNLDNKFENKFKYKNNKIIIINENIPKKDMQLINLISWELLNNAILNENDYLTKEKIYIIIQKIKNQMYGKVFDIKDLKIIYDRFINDDISKKVDDIENEVLKSLYISILKYDNLDELSKVLDSKNIKYKNISIMFVGLIIGYSSITRSISNKGKNKYINELIESYMDDIKCEIYEEYINNYYLKKNIKSINLLGKDETMFKLILNKQKQMDFNIKFNNMGNIFKVTINEEFVINFYTKIFVKSYRKFLETNKKIKIKINNSRNKFKYFSYGIVKDKKIKGLNIDEEKKLNLLLEKILM